MSFMASGQVILGLALRQTVQPEHGVDDCSDFRQKTALMSSTKALRYQCLLSLFSLTLLGYSFGKSLIASSFLRSHSSPTIP